MYSEIKNSIKKIELFNNSRFEIKKIYLRFIYFLKREKNIKFHSLLHESRYNEAYNFYLENILRKKLYSFNNLGKYLSLSMRLRKKEDIKIINSAILFFKQWSPDVYIFLLNNPKFKLLSLWLKVVCKNDKNLLLLLTNLIFYSNNEDKFIIKFLKSKEAAQKIQLQIKEVIAAMYFNDMQSNSLFYFSVFDHIINDYLISKKFKNKKIKNRCAILKLDPWTQSIGHFIYVDSFIKGVLLGKLNYDSIMFSKSPKSMISNKFLYKKYNNFLKKNFKTYADDECLFLEPSLDAWRANNTFVMAHNMSTNIQRIWKQKKNKPIVQFTENEKKEGKKFTSTIITNKKKWFCTIQVREPGFRFRDNLWLDTGRNANLNNYKKAISYINKNKGITVRLGQKRHKNISCEGYFDYGSSKFKSSFLDIYLLAEAKFHIGTTSGLSYLPLILGKYKNIFTNLSIPFFVPNPGSIGIPKLLKSTSSQKYQKFSTYEKFEPPMLFYGNENLKNLNLELVENSADDIYSLIKEFLRDFEKKEWENTLRKKKTFPINASNNIFCQNRIALPNYFIKKYKKLMY